MFTACTVFHLTGSLFEIIKSTRKQATKGGVLDEVFIATVLKEVLQGLEYSTLVGKFIGMKRGQEISSPSSMLDVHCRG